MLVPKQLRALIPIALAVLLSLAACQRTAGPATPQEIAIGAAAEQARAHLAAALENANAGRWDLAAVHAAHPSEAMPAIDSAVAKRDPAADAALRKRTQEIVQAAQRKDPAALRSLVEDADRQFARVSAIVMGEDRAAELSYRASVVASLVEAVADEYGEGVDDGVLRQEIEYQDAYVFLEQARALWSQIEPSVARTNTGEHAKIVSALDELRVAMPGLRAPASPVPAERVASLAKTIHEELREAVGARTGVAAAGANELKALLKHLDEARDALRAGNVAAAKAAYHEFQSGWGAIEDGIRARDRDAYRRIEDRMSAVTDALVTPDRPDVGRADAAVAVLDETIDDALPGIAAGTGNQGSTATFASAQAHLDAALAALDRSDDVSARAEIVAFRNEWTDIEGVVKARSNSAYGAIENDTAAALSRLARRRRARGRVAHSHRDRSFRSVVGHVRRLRCRDHPAPRGLRSPARRGRAARVPREERQWGQARLDLGRRWRGYRRERRRRRDRERGLRGEHLGGGESRDPRGRHRSGRRGDADLRELLDALEGESVLVAAVHPGEKHVGSRAQQPLLPCADLVPGGLPRRGRDRALLSRHRAVDRARRPRAWSRRRSGWPGAHRCRDARLRRAGPDPSLLPRHEPARVLPRVQVHRLGYPRAADRRYRAGHLRQLPTGCRLLRCVPDMGNDPGAAGLARRRGRLDSRRAAAHRTAAAGRVRALTWRAVR